MTRIVVYTCLFGNYDALKIPLHEDPRVEYVLFTDNKDIDGKVWKTNLIHKNQLKSDRFNSRLAKILSHKYLPDHDVSVYIDASFLLVVKDVFDMVKQCLGDGEIALWPHHSRNCIYDEIEYVLYSSDRVVDTEASKRLYSKYKNNNFPAGYGLFENGIIFRKNTERIRKLNSLWWDEYVSGVERDQFSLMYCLWKLNISSKRITVGEQVRKNPFVKYTRHPVLECVESNKSNIDIYIVYFDKFENWGTTRLRGRQIFNFLKDKINVEIIPYSKATKVYGKRMLVLKFQDYSLLERLLDNKNVLIHDMIDCRRKNILESEKIFKRLEFGIFATDASRISYSKYFKHPEKCITIWHHWDQSLELYRSTKTNKKSNFPKFGYFGVKEKGLFYDEIDSVDFVEVTSTNFDHALKSKMFEYNVQYILRPAELQDEFPAFTKVATAAAAGSVVIAFDSELEILGPSYPYYVKNDSREEVIKTIDYVEKTFGTPVWDAAVSTMLKIQERCSINSIGNQYLNLFKEFAIQYRINALKVPSKKVLYTANISSYDIQSNYNFAHLSGWDCYYFTTVPIKNPANWKVVDVSYLKDEFDSPVELARYIKVNSHLFFEDAELVVWIDANFKIVNKLDDLITKLPDVDFITVRHPKRFSVIDESYAIRVRHAVKESILSFIRFLFNVDSLERKPILFETGLIIRKNNPNVASLNNVWWCLMSQLGVYRDQLLLPLAVDQLNLDFLAIDVRTRNEYFEYIPHHKSFLTGINNFYSSQSVGSALPVLNIKQMPSEFYLGLYLHINSFDKGWVDIVKSNTDPVNNYFFSLRVKDGNYGQLIFGDINCSYVEFSARKILPVNKPLLISFVQSCEDFSLFVNGQFVVSINNIATRFNIKHIHFIGSNASHLDCKLGFVNFLPYSLNDIQVYDKYITPSFDYKDLGDIYYFDGANLTKQLDFTSFTFPKN